ncbi:MAG: hypothetical protein LBQ59_02615 [Candidatus Peribacteria bacterium]|nr:hypothetical protein [Candidatus Peribacteria bacterium]
MSKIIVSVRSGASFKTHHLQTKSIFISSFSILSSFFQKSDEKNHFLLSFSLFPIFIISCSSILILKKSIFLIKKIATINTIQIDTIQIVFKTLCFFFTMLVFLKAIKNMFMLDKLWIF